KKDKISNIVVFGEEPIRAYDRVHLTSYFSDKPLNQLYLAEQQWYAENDIELHLNNPVTAINRNKKSVISSKGLQLDYDFLVLATGSAAFVPPIPGVDKEGVFLYRTIQDLDLIKAYAIHAKKGAVIGGGLLGLEAAKALVDLGIEASTVIEFALR